MGCTIWPGMFGSGWMTGIIVHTTHMVAKSNPKGYVEGEYKSLRGGSWVNFPDSLRSAFRRWSRPNVRFNDTGFRCAKSAPPDMEFKN